jgi:hypothetical protein
MTPAEKKDTSSTPRASSTPGRSAQKEDLLKKKVISQATCDKIQDLVTARGPKKQSLPEGPHD